MPFILEVRLVDASTGVTQKEGHIGFLHLPSAVLVLIFITRKIQPSLFLVNREVEICVLYPRITCWALFFYFLFFVRKNPSSSLTY